MEKDTVVSTAAVGDMERLKEILQSGGNANETDDDGYGAVFVALYEGHVDTAKMLLDHGCKLFHEDGRSVLGFATSNCTAEMLEGVISHRRSIEILDYQEPCDYAPASERGRTALHWAVDLQNERKVRLLLEAGAYPNIVAFDEGTPLYQASAGNSFDIVKQLVEGGAEINIRQGSGGGPLTMAAAWGQVEIARYLLSEGADRSTRDEEDKSATDYAREHGHDDIVALLS